MGEVKPVDHDKVVATLAASAVMHRMVDEIPHLVNHALATTERSRSRSPAEVAQQRYIPRDYLPAPIPRHEVGPMMEGAAWRAGKGEPLGFEVLIKAGTPDKLFVQQYGQQCAVLYKDGVASHPAEGVNKVFSAFKVMDGEITHVISRLGTTGWMRRPEEPTRQMALLPGGAS